MKYNILLVGVLGLMLASCSSVYKASQTPDDVYFSPAKPSVAKVDKSEDRYATPETAQDDQYLRMKTRDRQKWSSLDDYSYWNDSRYVPSYSYDYYKNNWYNSYAWNNGYSPFSVSIYGGGFNSFGYYSPYSIYNPYNTYYNSYGYYNPYVNPYTKYYTPGYPTKVYSNTNRPALNGYTNRNYNNINRPGSTNRQSFGAALKRVFTPIDNTNSYNGGNNRNSNTYSPPSRSYSPSSSGSSGSSSSRGSGSVSRPSRH